jgi:folate-binding protein YgfZ
MASHFTVLPDRGALLVGGEDASAFLQGLITNDMKAADAAPIFAALLSPQGRFLHDFFVIRGPEGYVLETARARIPDLLKRLNLYKLRAKVTLSDISDAHEVVAAWGDAPAAVLPELIAFADPRHAMLGMRLLVAADKKPVFENAHLGAPATPEHYDLHRLTLGIPEGAADLTPERSLPMEYGYEHLHAIAFDKGCYVGQEVTARMKHRATRRKFVHAVRAEAAELPPKGTKVSWQEKEIGEMLSSRGNIGLAMLRMEEMEKAQALTADDVRIEAQLPIWLPAREEGIAQ